MIKKEVLFVIIALMIFCGLMLLHQDAYWTEQQHDKLIQDRLIRYLQDNPEMKTIVFEELQGAAQ